MRNGLPLSSTRVVPCRPPLDHSSSRYQLTSWPLVCALTLKTSGSDSLTL
ncbi:hypothetical protein STENM327S_08190 [Streptomyces tendae]